MHMGILMLYLACYNAKMLHIARESHVNVMLYLNFNVLQHYFLSLKVIIILYLPLLIDIPLLSAMKLSTTNVMYLLIK